MIRIALLCCLAAVVAFGADSRPSFEVASVKANQSDTGVDHLRNAGGTFLMENVSLRRYIAMAYGIPESREYLLSAPEWLESEHFDISAKYAAGTSNADSLLMLRRLLEERFALKVHRFLRKSSRWVPGSRRACSGVRDRDVGSR